jgi:ATP diphosphatase
MEVQAATEGRTLAGMSLDDQEALWQRAKGVENRSLR